MTLAQLISWAEEHDIVDFDTVDLEFNMSDGGPECFISVDPNGLSIQDIVEPTTGLPMRHIIQIDSY